ncbi:MAG: 50S ribosomal protein L11 methyltransferase [Bacteroidota bacterium]|nr:50S ribosomal protein L11 methyltransferase [Bacteroidota bacterium]
MAYIELQCNLFPQEPTADIITAQLAEIGFESFAESDSGILAYIKEEDFDFEKVKTLDIVSSDLFEISFEYSKLEDRNWNAVWESNYDPVTIADKCYIRAPFHPERNDVDYQILIEPQMSFGTAHHETTALMIEYLLDADCSGKVVMDMGCGTGVLAVLAELKGAADIVAIDNDVWAYRNTVENVKKNSCEKIVVIHGDATNIPEKSYDIFIANINKNILLNDIADYSKVIHSGGTLFLSGFYKHDIVDIRKEADRCGFDYVEFRNKNDWVAVSFIKR